MYGLALLLLLTAAGSSRGAENAAVGEGGGISSREGDADPRGDRKPREDDDYLVYPQQLVARTPKIKPGQYADKARRKTKNWKPPEFLKTAVSPSNAKVSWSYWETEDSESWPDDADDSQPPTEAPTTTTTTTTTKAPATKAAKVPVAVHKHYHYFKKAAQWPSPSPMPPEEMMMPMMPDEMMNEIMKGMMMPDAMMPPMEPPPPEKKGGLSGVLLKLSAVDPVTILVAGIIPASLILAAALPSVMNKMNGANKGGDPTMGPTMTPAVSTTAVGSRGGDVNFGRHVDDFQDPAFTREMLRAASQFGMQALKDPRCARQKFCRFAKKSLVSETPEFQRALQVATVIIQDSWLDVLGVRDILQSLSRGTCDETGCEELVERSGGGGGATQPTPV